MRTRRPFAQLTADEAAALVRHDTLVGFSGFTPVSTTSPVGPIRTSATGVASTSASV